jgi:hypothetical protein
MPCRYLIIQIIAILASMTSSDAMAEETAPHRLTYYWIVQETDYPVVSTGILHEQGTGVELAVVPSAFRHALVREGTGRLSDGRLVNLGNDCAASSDGNCFFIVDPVEAPYGWGSTAPLTPFRSLAAHPDSFTTGERVYLPSFDGIKLPSSNGTWFVHDGCFEVVDTGPSLARNQVDLFIQNERYLRLVSSLLGHTNWVRMERDGPSCGNEYALLNGQTVEAADLSDGDEHNNAVKRTKHLQ